MKHARFYRLTSLLASLRLAALTGSLMMLTPVVQADEYADVNQLLKAGKPAEALTKADAYLVTKPRDPQMRFIKGVIQRDAGKSAEAIATFTKLTEDYPELPEPYNNLAVLYASQNQYDKARSALEMAIRTNPSYSVAHENLGDVYAKLASQAYSKALQLDAGNAAVPPKLELIRELFTPSAKAAAASTGTTPAATGVVNAPAKPPVIAAKPAVTAPVVTAPVVTAPVVNPPAVTTPVTPPAAVVASQVPPAVVPAKAADNKAQDNAEAKSAQDAVQDWARAWSSKDVPAYLAAYGKDFVPPGGVSRAAWSQERRNRIAGKASISVKLGDVAVALKGSKAVVRFRQDYKAGALAISSRKTLELEKQRDRWLIVKESTGG